MSASSFFDWQEEAHLLKTTLTSSLSFQEHLLSFCFLLAGGTWLRATGDISEYDRASFARAMFCILAGSITRGVSVNSVQAAIVFFKDLAHCAF